MPGSGIAGSYGKSGVSILSSLQTVFCGSYTNVHPLWWPLPKRSNILGSSQMKFTPGFYFFIVLIEEITAVEACSQSRLSSSLSLFV